MKQIDLNNWNRKEHFEFFTTFEEPFFGVVADVDCSKGYQIVKDNGYSFYAWYMHKSLLAVNSIPEFRYRIVDGKPTDCEEVHIAGTTIREDETFGFTFVPYSNDFNTFQTNLQKESLRIKASSGLGLNKDTARIDVIHYSTLPWVNFSALTHAHPLNVSEGIPKITFGKTSIKENKMMLPVAVNVHHGLMDGLHVGKFFELFQSLMDGD